MSLAIQHNSRPPNRYALWESQPGALPPDPDCPYSLEAAPDDDVRLDSRRGSLLTDMLGVPQFVASGWLYQQGAKEAMAEQARVAPLSDASKVKLQDPLIIVPGWTTQPDKFDHLVGHLLSSGENGERTVYLKDGHAFTDKAATQKTEIQPDAKVFVAIFDHVLSAPDRTAPQLEKIIENAKKVVGERVDVLGYSMGGIAVRNMLDQYEEKLDQVAFLGSPHRMGHEDGQYRPRPPSRHELDAAVGRKPRQQPESPPPQHPRRATEIPDPRVRLLRFGRPGYGGRKTWPN